MPKLSIVAGIILILIGIAGYLVGVSQDKASITALIPAFLGLLMAIFGAIASSNEKMRKHLMHGSVLVALLGLIATLTRLIPKIGEFSGTPAQLSQLSTAIVCLAFVVFAVRSFIAARKEKA